MKSIELRLAYAWTCENCGTNNYAEGLVIEADSDTMAELRDDHGIQPWECGDFIEMPDIVMCLGRGEQYATIHFRDE